MSALANRGDELTFGPTSARRTNGGNTSEHELDRLPLLSRVVGLSRVRKLYIELLYRCNFNCKHCFHGERLLWLDAFSPEEAKQLITVFHRDYGTTAVTLLGGEPFAYRDLAGVASFAHAREMTVEVCTNGYRVHTRLAALRDCVDLLRVSIDGLEGTHDAIRRPGSFAAAMTTLGRAGDLGIRTSVTFTVTEANVAQLHELAQLLAKKGVSEIKLHCLRLVGNAAKHLALQVVSTASHTRLQEQIASASQFLPVLFDEDLLASCPSPMARNKAVEELERVEVQPNGDLYLSCKAVGAMSNAFVYNKSLGEIEYKPKASDELQLAIPQVQYGRL